MPSFPKFTIRKKPSPNAWAPSQRDLQRICQMAAAGATQPVIAAEFGITDRTLRDHPGAREALDHGQELNKAVDLGRMTELSRQGADLGTSFRATKWRLSAIHGLDETKRMNVMTDEEAKAAEVAETKDWLDRRIEMMQRSIDRDLSRQGPMIEAEAVEVEPDQVETDEVEADAPPMNSKAPRLARRKQRTQS